MRIRNILQLLFLFFASCLLWTGCSKDQDSIKKAPESSVSFNAGNLVTRSSNENWTAVNVSLSDGETLSQVQSSSMAKSSSVSTRGIAVTGSVSPSGSFGVLGYVLSGGIWNSSLIPSFMYNTQVTRQGSSSYTYVYYPYKYWPDNASDLVKFFAYYPYNGNGITLNSSSIGGYPTIAYSPSTTTADEVDLMYASPTAANNRLSNSAVNFGFSHALTRISFSVASTTSSSVIKVQSISLSGIRNKGVLSYDPSVSSNPWTMSSVSTDTTTYKVSTADGTLIPEANQSISNSDYQSVTSYSGYLLMLPQSLNTSNNMVVKYTIDGIDKVTRLNLPVSTWAQGQSVNYQLKLGVPSSNCYIVAPSSTFSFPISRVNECWNNSTYGNNSTYAIGATDTWTASIIWQDVSGVVTLSSSTGTGPNGVISINTSSDTGNALIGIKKTSGSGTGVYVWSWHIWVTNYSPSSQNVSYNSLIWMDRNLGATSNTGTNSYGLFYQWGRKDPFKRASQTRYTGSSSGNNLVNSINYPARFYYAGANYYDWYTNTGTQNDDLWSSTKTLYDPCPDGWKVPTNGSWSTLTTFNFEQLSYYDYGSTYTDSPSFFYPYSGYLIAKSGSLSSVRSSGFCWSSMNSSTDACNLYWDSGSVTQDDTNGRATGMSVRCVQDK